MENDILWPHFAHKWPCLIWLHLRGMAGDSKLQLRGGRGPESREGGLSTPRFPAQTPIITVTPVLPAKAPVPRDPPHHQVQLSKLRPRPPATKRTHQPNSEPQVQFLLNSPCWVSHLTSPSHSVLICKMGIMLLGRLRVVSVSTHHSMDQTFNYH